VRFRSILFAASAAGLLCALRPALSTAQVTLPRGVDSSRVRVWTNPALANRGPGWDFDIGMNPGPNHEYGYVYVARLEPGNAAHRAGLLVGDTILTVDGRDTRRAEPLFPREVPGTRYVLRIKRGEEEREIVYIYPAPVQAAQPARPERGTAPKN